MAKAILGNSHIQVKMVLSPGSGVENIEDVSDRGVFDFLDFTGVVTVGEKGWTWKVFEGVVEVIPAHKDLLGMDAYTDIGKAEHGEKKSKVIVHVLLLLEMCLGVFYTRVVGIGGLGGN